MDEPEAGTVPDVDWKKAIEGIKVKSGACPSCGYCPACGRGNSRPYQYPYWPYIYGGSSSGGPDYGECVVLC